MSDRSRLLRYALCVAAVCASCSTPSSEEQVKAVVSQALTSLYINDDLDAYLQEVDFDGKLDSIQYAAVESMYRQFADFLNQTHGKVTSFEVANADFESDSVCYVHFLLTFADNTSMKSMHKVVNMDGNWKIRGRN